ncbi:MAG TPA: sporulation protein YtfJ [Candidatus Fimenecus stercoravium]|nr:sporulation protein YtfJ [Candidatus Fimenecus stercoravium]
MKEQSAAGILEATIEKVKNLVSVSTIIGDPMQIEGMTIIPVSKVTYGFASGGSDFPSKSNQEIFGGGGGAGVTITPVAFLVISDGEVTLKHITAFDNAAERVVNLVPEMFDKVTSVVNKAKKEKARAAQDAADDALVSATMEELAKPEA